MSEESNVDGEEQSATSSGRTDAAADSIPSDRRERIASDPYCATLGIELRDVGPGTATTALRITDELVNFHGTPHGGAIYSLADAAFAAASNSHEGSAVALETNISYLEAVDVGTTLVATATETHLTRKTGEYEVAVAIESGDRDDSDDSDEGGEDNRVATFRGRVYRL